MPHSLLTPSRRLLRAALPLLLGTGMLTLVPHAGLCKPAASATRPPMHTAAPRSRVHGLYWKATSPTNTIYLLGSIHAGTAAMYPLPSAIEQAFDRSSVLVVEVNLNQVDQRAMQQYVMANGIYPANDGLFKHLSPKTAAALKQYCAANRMPWERLDRLKPWMVDLTISVLPFIKAGWQPGLGIDIYLMQKAKGHKPIEQLETQEQQLKLLSSLPPKLQDDDLRETISQNAHFREITQGMEHAWITGSVGEMLTLLKRYMSGSAEVNRLLIQNRNPHMADVATRYLKGRKPCFMVVGTAHLIGKDGVVDLLQRRGFRVEQIG